MVGQKTTAIGVYIEPANVFPKGISQIRLCVTFFFFLEIVSVSWKGGGEGFNVNAAKLQQDKVSLLYTDKEKFPT